MAPPKQLPLSSNPVLDTTETIYCSPHCGCKCTKAAYDNAVTEGRKLATRLGEGWDFRVWENWGWHFCAINGVCEVHPPHWHPTDVRYQSIKYTAYLNNSLRQTIGRNADPYLAVSDAILELRDMIKTAEGELMHIGHREHAVQEYSVHECDFDENGKPTNMSPNITFQSDNLHLAMAIAHKLATDTEGPPQHYCVFQRRTKGYRDYY